MNNKLLKVLLIVCIMMVCTLFSFSMAACKHNWVLKSKKEPTCRDYGIEYLECSKCHEKEEEYLLPQPSNHKYTVIKETKATCTKTGERKSKCTICGLVKTETIKKLGHNYVVTATTNATCTTNGSKIYKCTRSGCTSGKTETINKLGHNWVQQEMKIEDYPTCKTSGKKTYKCSRCNKTKTETISPQPNAHYLTMTKLTEGDCRQGSKYKGVCKYCGAVEISYASPKPHNYTKSVSKAPTCQEKGYSGKQCTVCGDLKIEKEYDKLDHLFGNDGCIMCGCVKCPTGHTYVVRDEVEGDCKYRGFILYECKVCKYTKTVQTTTVPSNHKWGNWNDLADGRQGRFCVRCSKFETREKPTTTSKINTNTKTTTSSSTKTNTTTNTSTKTSTSTKASTSTKTTTSTKTKASTKASATSKNTVSLLY